MNITMKFASRNEIRLNSIRREIQRLEGELFYAGVIGGERMQISEHLNAMYDKLETEAYVPPKTAKENYGRTDI